MKRVVVESIESKLHMHFHPKLKLDIQPVLIVDIEVETLEDSGYLKGIFPKKVRQILSFNDYPIIGGLPSNAPASAKIINEFE